MIRMDGRENASVDPEVWMPHVGAFSGVLQPQRDSAEVVSACHQERCDTPGIVTQG